MTNYGMPDVGYVIYNGYDLVGTMTNMSDEIVNLTEDTTVAGNAVSTQSFIGVQEGTVELGGFYDSALFAALQSKPSSVLMYALEGNTAGKYIAAAADAKPLAPRRAQESKAFTKANVSWACGRTGIAIDRALLIAALAARSTAGNTDASYVDLGATASNGVRFYVAATALTLGGYTNGKVTLRHCATPGGAYADITATAQTFTAIGGYMYEYTSSVNRYLSIAWSWTGSGSGQSITFTAAAAAR